MIFHLDCAKKKCLSTVIIVGICSFIGLILISLINPDISTINSDNIISINDDKEAIIYIDNYTYTDSDLKCIENGKKSINVLSKYKLKYNSYSECMTVACEAPYDINVGVNYMFDSRLFNENDRWKIIPNTNYSDIKIIIEIGCNVGKDSKRILDTYKSAILYCFEPIKILYETKLTELMNKYKNRYFVEYYGVSLNDSNEVKFMKLKRDQSGESISLWNETLLNNNKQEYDIFSSKTMKPSTMVSYIINKYNSNNNNISTNNIDILQMNCEGCEALVISELINTNIIYKINNIIMGTHCYEWIKPSPQYMWCKNHINLHNKGYIPLEIPQICAWERWQKNSTLLV